MERRQKICIVVKAFLEHPTYTMVELAELPEIKAIKVTRKTIPKYLNDPLIINLFGTETYNKIQTLLKQNKESIEKRRMGKMIESKRQHLKQSVNVLKPKTEKNIHVLIFTRIQAHYPKMTVEEITKLYNESNDIGEVLTVDYVSDCLSREAKEKVASQISNTLEQKASKEVNILNEIYKK